jgi:hypothetical protein
LTGKADTIDKSMLSSLLRSSVASSASTSEALAAAAAAMPLLLRSISSSSTSASSAKPSTSTSSSSSQKVAKGVNYQKAGSDPVIDTSSLPEWLPELSRPPPTAFELRRELESSSGGGGDDANENSSEKSSITGSLSDRQSKQLLKLEARTRIKERNSVKAKK